MAPRLIQLLNLISVPKYQASDLHDILGEYNFLSNTRAGHFIQWDNRVRRKQADLKTKRLFGPLMIDRGLEYQRTITLSDHFIYFQSCVFCKSIWNFLQATFNSFYTSVLSTDD
jgi:hypothetical protein